MQKLKTIPSLTNLIRLLFYNKILFFLIFQFFILSIFQFVFSQTQLDQFQYHYPAGSNRLTHIDDVIGAANSTVDIDDQAEGNYAYNAIGQLTKDEAEGIESIEWHVNGKVSSVTKTDGSTISFTYDAMGNRISKTLTTHNSQLTTFYLRDAKGNLMARYEQENSASINFKEFSLYGGSKLGTLETEIDQNAVASNDSTFTRTLATKNYELKDHLGNVRTVVSDIKNSTLNASNNPANFSADITMTSDYYSYGMQMPGRSYQSSNYKYGFQGKEKDDDLKGEGNSYDFGARLYDPRVGRWLSTDPLEAKDPARSTFCAMADNPTKMIDPDGKAHMSIDEFSSSEELVIESLGYNAENGFYAESFYYRVTFDGKTYVREAGETWEDVLRRENVRDNGSGVLMLNGELSFFTPRSSLVSRSQIDQFQKNKSTISGHECWDYAIYIGTRYGNSNPVGSYERIDILKNHTPTENAKVGVETIITELDAGRSVVVAIDIISGSNLTGRDGASDHYVNIVGYEVITGRLRFYFVENYLWEDPDMASDPDRNYFELMDDGSLRGNSSEFGKASVTHVRPNIK